MASNPILVRLPQELDDLLNEKRGTQTRAAFLTAALARYLGVDDAAARIPKRGRPRKKVTSFSPEDPPAPEEMVPAETIEIPDIASLRTVSWKEITDSFPWYIGQDARRTLYVSDDGSFVWFSKEERYESTGTAIVDIIKKHGGYWDRDIGGSIASPDVLKAVKARALRARPAWSIRPMRERDTDRPFQIEVVEIARGWALIRFDRPTLVAAGGAARTEMIRLVGAMETSTPSPWCHDFQDEECLVSLPVPMTTARKLVKNWNSLHPVETKATVSDRAQQNAWRNQPVCIERDTGLVHVTVALANPLHRILLASTSGRVRPGTPVGPTATVTGNMWAEIAKTFAAMKVAVREHRKTTSRFDPKIANLSAIPGWEKPAENSYRFFAHQQDGIRFLLDREMRGILGDEMGLGKTGTAIGAAVGCRAQRVLVVAPANARWVWDREIRGWSGTDRIFHVEESLQDLTDLPDAGWAIVTYDVLTARSRKFTPPDAATASWLRAKLREAGHYRVRAAAEMPGKDRKSASQLAAEEGRDEGDGKFTPFHFDARINPEIGNVLRNLVMPAGRGISSQTMTLLHRMGRRLSSEMLHALMAWEPDVVFADEAHRIKNRDAGRTRAVRTLIEDRSRGAVLLTGTPLRNHGGEGASLIEAILPGASDRLAGTLAQGHRRSDRNAAQDAAVAEIFKTIMVRRLKADVLDLPDKIRQWVEIAPQGEALWHYDEVMDQILQTVGREIAGGATSGGIAKAIMGLLSSARKWLGLAKVANPGTVDLIDDVVEAKGACLVFAHHRAVIAELEKQLRKRGRSIVTVHGETPDRERADAEQMFQEGKVEIFLGSINAAGEALTLHRADTCVFVELDWVPAAMHQAEDRGHRAGQTAKGYHIISLLAHMPDRQNLDEYVAKVLIEKLANINTILDEKAGIAGRRIEGTDASVRSRVIAALMSEAQRTDVAKNTQVAAARKRARQRSKKQ
ncbi:DEAD/DEAH box helicase [Gluconobacter sp. LMG 31484]|uniref:DEAD/DEAH box helicase n=1 Tax=Gluconobacter vitians TaxID=2728102 RepID=A0ABR9Y897_9PROT|nr:DEAD/DEAH box helicase [Gluconobacter vitians]MBF0860163.1 DEAD/DEAH box helicase [Gluconobacter vitians]